MLNKIINQSESHDDILKKSDNIREYIHKSINDSNEKSIIREYEINLQKLISNETKTLNILEKNNTTIDLKKIQNYMDSYLEKIIYLEQGINGANNTELKRLVLEADQKYRQIEAKYITTKFDRLNERLDDKILETENTTNSIMFNVVSIFLGISITSAMITGIEFISSEFVLFYFLSCAWVALTILTISAIYLKKFDTKTTIILIIYTIFSIVWIGVGIISYSLYEPKQDNIESKEQNSNETEEDIMESKEQNSIEMEQDIENSIENKKN